MEIGAAIGRTPPNAHVLSEVEKGLTDVRRVLKNSPPTVIYIRRFVGRFLAGL